MTAPSLTMTTCYHCRSVFDLEYGTYTAAEDDSRYFCGDCASAHYRICHSCDHYECRCCVVRPVDCGYDRVYCRGCTRQRLYQCHSCENYHLTPTDGGGYCDSCQPEYWDDDDDYDRDCGGLINDWNYQPRLTFHGDGPVYLGMELEISTNGNMTRAAQDVYGRLGDSVFLKEDSSIDSGFELVTHPMSHAYFAEKFDWQILRDLESHGCDAYGNGIHVHVSRAGFDSPSHVYRWMRLIYRNERAVAAIARRNPSQWGSFNTHDTRDFKHYAKGYKRGAERYSAINVQNEHTFEVRVFRGSLNQREVRAALDLVAGSVEYTRQLTVPAVLAGGWTWAGFMAWAATDERYAALVAESEALV